MQIRHRVPTMRYQSLPSASCRSLAEIIRGLTTAASVWLMAAIGMAISRGLCVSAVCGTAPALAFLAGVKPLERKLSENADRGF
jgi:putative Mg2+ transporter-C (MgtC) family protein